MFETEIKSAEILCVGTELLLGDIVNTNAAFMSQRLAEMGIPVYRQFGACGGIRACGRRVYERRSGSHLRRSNQGNGCGVFRATNAS